MNSAPSERDGPRSISSFLDQRLVKVHPSLRMNTTPAVLAQIVQTRNICTKIRRRTTTTLQSSTAITNLIVQYIRFYFSL